MDYPYGSAAKGPLVDGPQGPGRYGDSLHRGYELSDATLAPSKSEAVALGRRAASMMAAHGGAARTRALSPSQRSVFAKALAAAAPYDCVRAIGRAGGAEDAAILPFDNAELNEKIADWLGVPFYRRLPDELAAVVHPPRFNQQGAVFEPLRAGGYLVIAPDAQWLPMLGAAVVRSPNLAASLIIVPFAEAIRRRRSAGPITVQGVVEPLHAIAPDRTAARTLSHGQATVIGGILGSALVAALILPSVTVTIFLGALTALLLGYAASRAMALFDRRWVEQKPPERNIPLPVYSILVPVHREAAAIPGLVHALRRLDYPSAKLDVMFLLEEGDHETRAAIECAARDWPSRIIVLPKGQPQTKPRALNAGLRQAAGALVTIFDAEDRPDPGQLRAAVAAFRSGPKSLGAVQARLTIDHHKHSWITRMFAIEYACLFNFIMPMVTRRGGLVLLGGTSNHFRRSALMRVGGWDPFNVTEDADLAIRLRRAGYRIQMLNSDTFEEAPLTMSAWLKQRARWFKGYMQTLLVHSRHPVRLIREVGWSDVALMYLFIVGALGAALAHLVVTAQLALMALGAVPASIGIHPVVIGVQLGSIIFGYGANIVLGAVSAKTHESHQINPLIVFWFPVYWLLMGAAVIVALYDLVHRPHHWRKTEHGLAIRPRRIHIK